MSSISSIEWTDATWNPVRGCSRVSPGCQHCYAENFAIRLSGEGKAYHGLVKMTPKGPQWTNKTMIVEHALDQPIHWKKPKTIFVNSMSDMFHESIDESDIQRIFEVMCEADHHVYQILTKRSERLTEMADRLPWPDHIWIGVSVESADYLRRLDDLRTVPTNNRFISAEPLLGPLGEMNLDGIAWVIAGGESGRGCRSNDGDWFREIRDQCAETGTMFHFKQWGGFPKAKYGRVLDGRTYDDMPCVNAPKAKKINRSLSFSNTRFSDGSGTPPSALVQNEGAES